MKITVWVCPTNGCGHFYAAPGAGDLASSPIPVSRQNGQADGSLGMRSRCPWCAVRGDHVDRVPHLVDLADGSIDCGVIAALHELHDRVEALARRTDYAEAQGLVHDVNALLEMVA